MRNFEIGGFVFLMMNNSDQVKQDQRTSSGMEDSTAMTVEFLRARLLSERAVSKSTRQRADELAKRVAELEEQLEIVSLQRRRAEKATADVLAILESNGVSDISEEFSSSSDQENPYRSKMDNNSAKEGESSVDSNLGRREEPLGSDLDSPVNGRSLSWKGRKGASSSPEKRYKDSLARRRSGFSSANSSSSKHRQGKSCRQIRRRESRSSEVPKTRDVNADSQENGGVTSSRVDDSQSEGDISGACSEIPEDTRSDALNGYEGEKNMERALQHQARLIGRYEAMERAQREWEEKFRENISGIQDSFDLGNHSDVSEERNVIKRQPHHVAEKTASQALEDEREQPNAQPRDFVPPSQADSNSARDQRHGSSSPTALRSPESHVQDFAFPVANGNYNRDFQETQFSSPSPPGNFKGSQQQNQRLSDAASTSSVGEASGRQHDQYAMVLHEPYSGYSGVLDALKQAKLSLQQKIEKSSLVDGKSIQLSIPGTKAVERPDIPIGCAGLFRTPIDFPGDSTKDNFFGSGSRLGLPNSIPNAALAVTSSYMNTGLSSRNHLVPGDLYRTAPCTSTGSATAFPVHPILAYMNAEHPTSRYSDAGFGMLDRRPSFDHPHMSSGLPNYPSFSTFPRSMPGIGIGIGIGTGTGTGTGTSGLDGFPAFNSSRPSSSPDMFPFHDKHFRPDMYR